MNDKISPFEEKLWTGQQLTDEEFNQYENILTNHLRSELSSRNQDNFSKSLVYLEKIKTLRLIKIFYRTQLFHKLLPQYRSFLSAQWKATQFFAPGGSLENSLTDSSMSLSFEAAIASAREKNPLLINLLIWQRPIEISRLQKFLSSKEVIIDYLTLGGKIYAFLIYADSLNLVSWQIDSSRFVQSIDTFCRVLFKQNDILDLKFDSENCLFLYNSLMKPLQSHINEYSRLIIIPDRPYIALPFECLIYDTEPKPKQENALYAQFSAANFLIKKFAISYAYSLSSLDPAAWNLRDQIHLGRRLLTMSEISFPDEPDSLLNGLVSPIAILNRNDDIQNEIKRVSRLLFRHDNIKGSEANFHFLKTRAKNYRWIYLAQLGILDGNRPLESALMISANNAEEPHLLNIDSILSIPFRADLITLSSTIIPDVENSDLQLAAIALPQAFLLSGNKSLLHSFWVVNAPYVSEFMSKFYWELKYKRQHNTLALQGAKLAALHDSFDYLGQKISTAHPYFWAGYRLIGSPHVSSPSNAKIPPWGVVIIAYVVVFIVSLIITRKTRSKE